jgi:hypothetical protein
VTHLTHGDDGVFTSVPDSLDVDVLGEVPDLLFGHEGVVVGRVHDSGVVELSRRKSVEFQTECWLRSREREWDQALTMTSNLPNSSTARLTIASTWSSLLTSHLTAMALILPSNLFWIKVAVRSAASRLISARMRDEPSVANRREVSRPIPLENRRGVHM